MFLDICNFNNFEENEEIKCLDFSKHLLTFQKPPENKDPPKELNGITKIAEADDNRDSERFIWSKFIRYDEYVYSKCSLPNENWPYVSLKRNYIEYFPYNQIGGHIRYLNLSKCRLTFVGQLPEQMIYFNASDNLITECKNNFPNNLEVLKLANNRLQAIPNIPTNIKKLDISDNMIKSIPEDDLLATQIGKFNYERNPIFFSERVIDFLEHIGRYYELPFEVISHRKIKKKRERRVIISVKKPSKRTIYSDSQNVHNHYIYQQSKEIYEFIKSKIEHKVKDKEKIDLNIILKKYLSKKKRKRLLKIFSEVKNVTLIDTNLREILENFCNYVELNLDEEYRKNVFVIVKDEIPEMETVCISGRLMRLFNSLTGIDDNICIEISPEQQKQAKINIILKGYNEEIGKWPLNIEYHTFYEKLKAIRENIRITKKYIDRIENDLSEIGINQSEIYNWTADWKYDIEDYEKILENAKEEIEMFDNGEIIKCYYNVIKNNNSEFGNLFGVKNEWNIFNEALKTHNCNSDYVYYTKTNKVICHQCCNIKNRDDMEYIGLGEIS